MTSSACGENCDDELLHLLLLLGSWTVRLAVDDAIFLVPLHTPQPYLQDILAVLS